jgi:hypothetical protein
MEHMEQLQQLPDNLRHQEMMSHHEIHMDPHNSTNYGMMHLAPNQGPLSHGGHPHGHPMEWSSNMMQVPQDMYQIHHDTYGVPSGSHQNHHNMMSEGILVEPMSDPLNSHLRGEEAQHQDCQQEEELDDGDIEQDSGRSLQYDPKSLNDPNQILVQYDDDDDDEEIQRLPM